VKVWIDVDNPPQVQYLTPLRRALAETGAEVVLTARAYGNTLDLLRSRGESYIAVGGEFGRSRVRKVAGLARRARKLRRVVARGGAPKALLAASRPAAVAARTLGAPSFIIGDYEYANVSVYRLTGSYLLYPDVVDPEIFWRRGLRRAQLIPFHGLKEDISFSDVDVDAVPAHNYQEIDEEGLVRVLFRPPAEESHYYDPRSGELAERALEYLASREEAVLIFAPRHPWQVDSLARWQWQNEPIVLGEAVPFVSLLKSIDLVLCSGGTMLREAAYLGIPAYSLLRSRPGGVDLYLESIGRVTFLNGADDLDRIELRKAGPVSKLESNPDLATDVVEILLSHTPNGA
jgi:uncharacterized protein